MSTDFTDTSNPSCNCLEDPDLDTLRDLVAAGMDQRTASRVLWASPATLALEERLAYAAHQAEQTRASVRAAFVAAFPWLRLPEAGVA